MVVHHRVPMSLGCNRDKTCLPLECMDKFTDGSAFPCKYDVLEPLFRSIMSTYIQPRNVWMSLVRAQHDVGRNVLYSYYLSRGTVAIVFTLAMYASALFKSARVNWLASTTSASSEHLHSLSP